MSNVCSFCNKSSEEVGDLFSGANGNICSHCLQIYCQLSKNINHSEDYDDLILFSPEKIKSMLDSYVIGNNDSKKIFSVLLFQHLLKQKNSNLTSYDKTNCIIIGKSGTGKTLLAKTAAKILNIPCHIVDCTTLTESGYVGDDVNNIFLGLLREANWDSKKAEQGIVFLDEIDKKAKKYSSNRDISGEGVQQSLLKLIEGKTVVVKKDPDSSEEFRIDTSNILFVASGSFVGIDDIVKKRSNKFKMGFHSNQIQDNIKDNIDFEDLITYGMIPEFIGRFSIILEMEDLNEEELIQILSNTKNSIIKNYQNIFEIYDIKLTFSKDLLQLIANKAIILKLGVRGLKSILDPKMSKLIFGIESFKDDNVKSIFLDKDFLNDNKIYINNEENL